MHGLSFPLQLRPVRCFLAISGRGRFHRRERRTEKFGGRKLNPWLSDTSLLVVSANQLSFEASWTLRTTRPPNSEPGRHDQRRRKRSVRRDAVANYSYHQVPKPPPPAKFCQHSSSNTPLRRSPSNSHSTSTTCDWPKTCTLSRRCTTNVVTLACRRRRWRRLSQWPLMTNCCGEGQAAIGPQHQMLAPSLNKTVNFTHKH